jgi:hypothetical protein
VHPSSAFGFSITRSFLRQECYLFNYEIGPNLNVENENYVIKCLFNDTEQKQDPINECCAVLNYLIDYNHYQPLNKIIFCATITFVNI